jgi:hypothetical protein
MHFFHGSRKPSTIAYNGKSWQLWCNLILLHQSHTRKFVPEFFITREFLSLIALILLEIYVRLHEDRGGGKVSLLLELILVEGKKEKLMLLGVKMKLLKCCWAYIKREEEEEETSVLRGLGKVLKMREETLNNINNNHHQFNCRIFQIISGIFNHFKAN